jgi:hypothetical protein
MAATLIRLMGETDIVDIDPTDFTGAEIGAAHPKLMGLDAGDRVNLLGHWLDQGRGEALSADPDYISAMNAIAKTIIDDHQDGTKLGRDANFAVLTILREKWPVGSKAKFSVQAARVGAQHTYLVHLCAPAMVEDLTDEASLKQAETTQLMMALPMFKRMRKQFANSSAVQTLIRQS